MFVGEKTEILCRVDVSTTLVMPMENCLLYIKEAFILPGQLQSSSLSVKNSLVCLLGLRFIYFLFIYLFCLIDVLAFYLKEN